MTASPASNPLADLFTEDELLTLLKSFATTRGRRGFYEEEAAAVLSWANDARICQGLLEGVLHGSISIDITLEGEPIFAAIGRVR